MHTYRETLRKSENDFKNFSLWVITLYLGNKPRLFREDNNIFPDDDTFKTENYLKEFLEAVILDEHSSKLKEFVTGRNANTNIGGVGAIPLKPKVNT